MKKMCALLLAAIMCFSLTACGNNPQETDVSSETSSTETDKTVPEETTSEKGTRGNPYLPGEEIVLDKISPDSTFPEKGIELDMEFSVENTYTVNDFDNVMFSEYQMPIAKIELEVNGSYEDPIWDRQLLSLTLLTDNMVEIPANIFHNDADHTSVQNFYTGATYELIITSYREDTDAPYEAYRYLKLSYYTGDGNQKEHIYIDISSHAAPPAQEETSEVVTDDTSEKMHGDWITEELDRNVFENMVAAVIDEWIDYGGEGYRLDDELLKDVVVFKSPEGKYYGIIFAERHVKEVFNPDGTSVYEFSNDPSDLLENTYAQISFLESDGIIKFITGLTIFEESFETALEDVQKNCGSTLVQVLSDDLRAEFVETVNGNVDIYSEMSDILRTGEIVDAANLYYQTTNLTYNQSRQCLLLLAMYERLNWHLDIVHTVYGGKLTVNDYSLSWFVDLDAENENEVTLELSYIYSASGGTLSVNRKSELEFEKIKLDVEGKTYTMVRDEDVTE